jgi:hypothetical protein
MTPAVRLRSSFSVAVADLMRAGFSLHEALRRGVGIILDGSGPLTSDVLADLETLGAWHPHPEAPR